MSRTSAVGSWILNSSIDTSMFSSSTDFSVDGTYFCDGSISTLTKISIDPSPRAFSLYSYLMLYCPTNGNTSGITSFYFSYQNSKMAPSQDGTYIRTGSPSVFSTINSTESDFNDYKIFTITGGDDVANADLISWLEANATFVESGITVTIKSYDAQTTLAEATNLPDISDALLTVSGNKKTLTLTDVDGATHALEWESQAESSKEFKGLSQSVASTLVFIGLDTTVGVNLEEDTTLYESYKDAEPEKISIDLTTLSGYEALAAGTYNIAVKAKADGYQDSDLSETVEHTKEADFGGVTVLYNDQPVNAVTYDGQTVNKIVYEEATT